MEELWHLETSAGASSVFSVPSSCRGELQRTLLRSETFCLEEPAFVNEYRCQISVGFYLMTTALNEFLGLR